MSTLTSPVDIRADHLEIVQDILCTHLPAGFEVWVFGSRANWTTKDSSDLDLAVEGAASLDHGVMVGLEIAFEESDLPYTVDVVDLNAVSPGFKRIVEDQRVLLPSMATSHLPDKKIVAGRHDTTQGWRQVNLGDIAEIFDGPYATPKKTEDGPVFLGISNLVNGRIDLSTAEHLSDSDYATWTKRVIPQPGDIVFSYETRLGEAAAIPPGLQCCLGRRMGLLRVSKEFVDPQFLLYAYLGPEFQGTLQSRTVQGSTVDRILLTELGTFPIRIPLLPEQRAIAHILGTLDDKIELNRRMNQTLEEMARAIFQDWFVDFGPVRAKLEGREPYLPPDLWSLFPDRLVDSQLGEIPEGWDVKTLGELCDKPQYGYTASAKDEPVGPKFLRITDINKLAWIAWGAVPHCDIPDEDFEKYRLYSGDILIARMADPGHGCMMEEDRDAVFASYLIRFRPKVSFHARLIQYWLCSDEYWELVRGRGAGTTRTSLNAKVLGEFPLVVPSTGITKLFGEKVGSLRNRVVANSEESRALSAQRDALLPKLVSGELSVADCS